VLALAPAASRDPRRRQPALSVLLAGKVAGSLPAGLRHFGPGITSGSLNLPTIGRSR